MSVRVQLCGFRLSEMQALFGGGDHALLNQFKSEPPFGGDQYDDSDKHLIDRFNTEFLATLQHAADIGVPIPGLSQETNPHIVLAARLCEQQDRFNIYHVDWTVRQLQREMEKLKSKVPSRHHRLLDYLSEGRPLFGTSMRPTPQYYAYWLVSEIQELRPYLKPYTPPKPKEFVGFDPEYEQLLIQYGYLDGPRPPESDIDDFAEENNFERGFTRCLYELESAGKDLWLWAT